MKMIRIWIYNNKTKRKERGMSIIEKRIFQIYLKLLYWWNDDDFWIWIILINLYKENWIHKFFIISFWNYRINNIDIFDELYISILQNNQE